MRILPCTASTRTEITEQELKLVCHGYELWNAGDLRGLAREVWSPDIEWQNAPEWPGQAEYRGADAVVDFLEEEVVKVIELGDVQIDEMETFGDQLLVRLTARTRGHGSQLDIGMVPVFHVARITDGKVSRVRAFLTESEAVEAAKHP